MLPIDHFKRRRRFSQYWLNKSEDLRASAAALWLSGDESISQKIVEYAGLGKGFSMAVAVSPVYSMLCGLSLELILKAIIVERGLHIPEHHQLVNLAQVAAVKYSSKEKQLLEILSHSVTWEGRYPTPTENKKDAMDAYYSLVMRNLFDRVQMGSQAVLQRNDALNWESFDGLWSKAAQGYWNHRENQTDAANPLRDTPDVHTAP